MVRLALISTSQSRPVDIRNLLNSIVTATEANLEIEVFFIFVAQSKLVADVVEEYNIKSSRLKIEIVGSDICSLSSARNLGLKLLQKENYDGKIDLIAFPDDDCTYPEEIFTDVVGWYQAKTKDIICRSYLYPGCNIPINNIIDRTSIISRVISFSFFIEYNKLINFDENLGVGTLYGAGEETKYLFKVLGSKGKVEFCENIMIFHPDRTGHTLSRTYNYSKGFGYLAWTYICVPNIRNFYCAMRLIFGPSAKLILGRTNIKFYALDQLGRIVGFLKLARK